MVWTWWKPPDKIICDEKQMNYIKSLFIWKAMFIRDGEWLWQWLISMLTEIPKAVRGALESNQSLSTHLQLKLRGSFLYRITFHDWIETQCLWSEMKSVTFAVNKFIYEYSIGQIFRNCERFFVGALFWEIDCFVLGWYVDIFIYSSGDFECEWAIKQLLIVNWSKLRT